MYKKSAHTLSNLLSFYPLYVISLVCAANGEAISMGQSPGEWLGLWGDVLGPGPPQRKWHKRTWLSQSCLTSEEALFKQHHCSSQVPTLRRTTGPKVVDRGEHVSHRQQQQHIVAPAGMCFELFLHRLVLIVGFVGSLVWCVYVLVSGKVFRREFLISRETESKQFFRPSSKQM